MKISTKGRYALRLMLGIALRGEGEPASLRDIARQEGISDKYLEQIVTPLNRAGLVKSVRGAGGGYLLTRPTEEYTVGEILRVLEGELVPVACADAPEGCSRSEFCVTQEVWAQVAAAVANVVDNITLADLARRYREKQGPLPKAGG